MTCSTCRYVLGAAISILYFIGFPAESSAERAQSDINGDGLSDLELINIDQAQENILSWNVRLSNSGQVIALGNFGKAGDNVIMADWLGSGSAQIGVVSLPESGQIQWRVLDPSNGELSKSFASDGDIAVSGADFNNNGISDAAAVSLQDGSVLWKLWLDAFSPQGPGEQLSVPFGQRGDRFFYADPNGNGDWLALLRKDGTNKSLVILKNPLSGEERTIHGSSALIKTALRPLPVKQKDGRDMLVAPLQKGGKTIAYIKRLDGTRGVSRTLRAKGEIVVGNFNKLPGEELAVQTRAGFLIFNPAKRKSKNITAPKGIVVDEININQMGGSPEDWESDDDGDSTPGTGSLADVCAAYSVLKFPEMLIKSSSSGHISPTDPRASGYTVLCGTQCPRNTHKADIYYADGTYACSVGKYSIWSATGKPRMYGGAGGAAPHSAKEIAAAAANRGNGKLYIQISRVRKGANSFCKEFNATGRSGGVRTSYGVAK